MSGIPDFATFYGAVNRGREPFPWQRRLAARVVERGWPDEIGVPTGLGKTSCLDIAVWALAMQADLAPGRRTAPTRCWYVVNRRLLVDAAFDHGTHLARVLDDPQRLSESWPEATREAIEAVDAVARALRSIAALGTEHGPLHITRLRGGADLGARVPDPSQPALVFATVPMFASRWLFRGFGTSVSMRPVDAAHAGVDSVVLLDEAHLARPLADLARPLAQCDPGDPTTVLSAERSRPRLVALTATGEGTGDRFDLDDVDLAHPIVRRRLEANKPLLRVDECSTKKLPGCIADNVISLLDHTEPTSCLVFVNSPTTARLVHDQLVERLRAQGNESELFMLTGRMREREAAAVRHRLLGPEGAPSGRESLPRERSLVVVATQTLEVGADVDFDSMVTESAGVRAMVQRLGRVNRLGRRPSAPVVVCHPSDRKDGGLYGDEPTTVCERLGGVIDRGVEVSLGPQAVTELLGEPDDRPPRSGELLPHHVRNWVKTSAAPPGETPPALFYQGIDDEPAPVSVCWRAHVPGAGQPLVPPLGGDETIDLPVYELRRALDDRGVAGVHRLAADRTTVVEVEPSALAPGDQVVLPTVIGLYDQLGWNPASHAAVLDLGLLRAGMVILTPEAIDGWLDGPVGPAMRRLVGDITALAADDDDPDRTEDTRRVIDVVDALRSSAPHPWLDADEWTHLLDGLVGAAKGNDGRVVVDTLDGPPFVQIGSSRRGRAAMARVRSDAFDELSFGYDAASPALDEHLGSVGDAAARIGERVGLPPQLVAAVRRAGQAHDLGKADDRFQRWLDPEGLSTAPLAKSSMAWHRREQARVASGWPRGGRHELLSARLVQAAQIGHDIEDDLVVHLVMSHHGHGRPMLAPVDDPHPTKVVAKVDGAEVVVSGDLAQPAWEQPARFRRLCETYGYWGLALLEAVLRQADHAASQFSEVR